MVSEVSGHGYFGPVVVQCIMGEHVMEQSPHLVAKRKETGRGWGASVHSVAHPQ